MYWARKKASRFLELGVNQDYVTDMPWASGEARKRPVA